MFILAAALLCAGIALPAVLLSLGLCRGGNKLKKYLAERKSRRLIRYIP